LGNKEQPPWPQIDSRIDWLIQRLNQLKPNKALVITSNAETALDIVETLRTRAGIHAAVFHEGMTILERDRAAAFFADPELGSQVLVCSEIGSEGRNFQFAHHLIMFDLPFNPDLLEQRIGRLDRIGQTQTIKIDVPYLQNSAQEIMFKWLHEGLFAFEHTCPAGPGIFSQIEYDLLDSLHQLDEGISDLPELISTTQTLYHEMSEALQQGRDRLLEYNSLRPTVANQLRDLALQEDAESRLPEYMDAIFDSFGVETEYGSPTSTILHPGDHMQTSSFPELPADGLTVTFHRQTALINENISFLTWEHPMVTGAMDMILSSEIGNTAVTAIKLDQITPGTMLVECLYLLDVASGEGVETNRYLPPTTTRLLVDRKGKDYHQAISHEFINQNRETVNNETANKIISAHSDRIRQLVAVGQELVQQRTPQMIASARSQMEKTLDAEINRLVALKLVNPNIRDQEVTYFRTQKDLLNQVLDSASLRLEALRLVIAM
jgi:ATP-dependent helicase HepA